jgi:uncharacterized membrane protein (DUF485 family)
VTTELRELAAKRKFIIPAVIFFAVYYFALPVLVGYAPQPMSRRAHRGHQYAWSFALCSSLAAWQWLPHVRAAGRFGCHGARYRPAERKGSADQCHLHWYVWFRGGDAGRHPVGSADRLGSSAYFAAGRLLTAWQNGIAVAGDYMSAASFLGIAGIIAFQDTMDLCIRLAGWLPT